MMAEDPGNGSSNRYSVSYHITRLYLRSRTLRVDWNDGHVSDFHYLWLRDNCSCPACVNPATQDKTFEITSVPEDITVQTAELDETGALRLIWSCDGHISRYHPGWLRAHCYSDWARSGRRHRPILWGADLQEQVSAFPYEVVLHDDRALLEWLTTLRDMGVTILFDAPVTPGTVGRLAKRVSLIRPTHHGVLFDVWSRPDTNDTPDTPLELSPHTDLPTREHQPGLQFLHCLVNEVQGGESILVDGFKVAEALRQEEPEAFEVLSRIPLDFYNKDRNSDYRSKAPVIGLDHEGGFREIRLANFLRGPFDVPWRQMEAVYHAFRHYYAMTKERRFQIYLQLVAGTIMVIDNCRVLHARRAFDQQSGAQHLQGCYLDRDDLLSRIRVLERTH